LPFFTLLMKQVLYIFILFSFFTQAQSKKDSLNLPKYTYLEDQFFAGVTYNLLRNTPKSIKLRGFSNAMFIGYIRDLPFDKNRNYGLAMGLGYSYNTYFHNMKIVEIDNQTYFSDFEDIDDYSSNKLIYHTIDLPFEFRFRKSTYDTNKFFRFYFGWKLSYVVYHKSQFNLNITETKKYGNFNDFKKLQYGVTASIGHGTWNGYFYYGLTNLFENVQFNDEETLNTKSLKFGLIWYIL